MSVSSQPPVRRSRWGFQTSLFQFREPAFYLFAALLLWGVVASVREQLFLLDIAPGGWVLSWGLLAVSALPVVIVVRRLDVFEREPTSLLLGAVAWGAFVATWIAAIGNGGWAAAIRQVLDLEPLNQWLPALTAPIVEETAKGMCVVLFCLIARKEIDDLMDGFIYGALVGFGFMVVEDVGYFVGSTGGSVGEVLELFYLRVVASGLYGHMLYTGLTGIGIAYLVTRRDQSLQKRLLVAGALYLAGMTAHFVWNSPLLDFYPTPPFEGVEWIQIALASAVKGIPALILVVILLRLAQRRERYWLELALGAEVGKGGITTDELQALATHRSRRPAITDARARSGRQAGALVKRLHREQFTLGMVATKVDSENDPDLLRQRALCQSIRESVQGVPVDPLLTPPPPVATSTTWVVTHTVPPGGLSAWQTPDPSIAPAWELAETSELRVVEVHGAWVRVDAPNGWSGWVDSRRLVIASPRPVS